MYHALIVTGVDTSLIVTGVVTALLDTQSLQHNWGSWLLLAFWHVVARPGQGRQGKKSSDIQDMRDT